MCLVFLAFQVSGVDPILLGANREESRRRPSTSPICRRSGSIRTLLAGGDWGPDGFFPELGTWLGVNEAGLVVAVTNRRDGELAPAAQFNSRGLLTVSLLDFDEPERAAEHACRSLGGGGYGGCNYLVASTEAAFVVHAPAAHRISQRQLQPGVHVLANLDVDDVDDPRIRLVCAELEPEDFVASAQAICRDERIVMAGPERGTVSSSLVVVGSTIQFYHTTGDPRAGDYETFRAF